MQTLNRLKSLPPLRFDSCSRAALRDYFLNTWGLYESLKSSIRREEYFYESPDPLRNPLIFYLGHTAAFYINKLKMSGYLDKGINDRFEVLLAVGVDPENSEELDQGINWPSVKEVWAYRAKVKEVVLKFIENAPLIEHVDMFHPIWALHMAMEHERIHFETSSVLIRQYPTHYLESPADWNLAPANISPKPEAQMVSFPAGKVKLGKPKAFPTYGWDNEYGELEMEAAPFEVRNLMVTNAEFLDFVKGGGYDQKEYWTDEAWEWKLEYEMHHPRFWVPAEGGGYRYRAMFEETEMPLDWPVEATCYEAQAYCSWLGDGYRLMTEREWKIASSSAPESQGDTMFSDCYNMNLAYFSPSPVGYMERGKTPEGLHDIYGNVWDWISNDHYPLPGFQKHPWYLDFSEPFMDSQHGMLLGGGWATSGTGASKYYRLWFRRGFFQHAGFRLARSI